MGKMTPSFGDVVENGWASEDNPTRKGFFVRAFTRTGRMNSGLTWEITDGKGKFWTFKPRDIGERLTVVPAARSEAQPSGYDGLRQALAEAIEFAEQDWQALTPEGDAMLDRWRAAITFTASLSDASPSSGDE